MSVPDRDVGVGLLVVLVVLALLAWLHLDAPPETLSTDETRPAGATSRVAHANVDLLEA